MWISTRNEDIARFQWEVRKLNYKEQSNYNKLFSEYSLALLLFLLFNFSDFVFYFYTIRLPELYSSHTDTMSTNTKAMEKN